MEKPTYTAIDYNSLENKVIEGLVRDNYSKIKNTFYKVFNKRVKNPNSPVGLCADLIFKCGMFSFIERMVIRLEEY